MKNYKTFQDLQFKPWLDETKYTVPELIREQYEDAYQAIITFDNGYGASILSGKMFYSDGYNTYEIACLDKDGHLCYPENSSFSDDVCGYCTPEEINQLLKEIQDFV